MSGNIFQTIKMSKPGYSYFDLSHDHKTTFNMGELIPVLCQETLPGDKYQISSEAMLRFQPLIAPIMHRVDIYIHHFFVPNRILWKDWEKFISPPTIDYDPIEAPYLFDEAGIDMPAGGLADRLGYPPGYWSDLMPSALPFSAYQAIWYEYYRDQNLTATDFDDMYSWCGLRPADQSSTMSHRLNTLQRRAWEHDYFTSCLPFAQKGEPVSLPIEVTAEVNVPVQYSANNQDWLPVRLDGTPYLASGGLEVNSGIEGPDGVNLNFDPQQTLRAVGETAEISTTTTINDLRAAYALQKFLEKNARGGTRYTETLLVHFGVRSSDARLQRPEYLGGSRSTMAISEVLQTDGNSETPQGNMAGHGISTMQGNYCSYYCEEHGFIISLMSVRPKTAYGQGIPKFMLRRNRLDYYFPDFALLGEEPVLNCEVFLQNTSPNTNRDTFGYLPRFSEYRYIPSRVSGEFHTNLNYWALHRQFVDPPALNTEFIECTPSGRIFAIDPATSDSHSIIAHVYHSITARRPLPKYGNPGGLI